MENKEQYIVVYDWMRNKDYGLKGLKTDLYALVCGIGEWYGEYETIAKRFGYSVPKICVALNEMTEAGLLIKTLNYKQGTKRRYTYTINKKIMGDLQKVYGAINKTETAPLTESQSNNKDNNKDITLKMDISVVEEKTILGEEVEIDAFSEKISQDVPEIKDVAINQKEMAEPRPDFIMLFTGHRVPDGYVEFVWKPRTTQIPEKYNSRGNACRREIYEEMQELGLVF